MCIRDRPLGPKSDFGKSRALLPEKAPLLTLSPGGREGEEFSLREIFRDKLDWGRHFSAALDKGDHRGAHGKKFAPSVRVWYWKLKNFAKSSVCLLYTSDAADERSSVDLGGRRIIKKKRYKI